MASNPFLSVICDKCKVPINSDTRFEYLCGHIICRVCDTGRVCHYCGHPGPANQLSSDERRRSDICEACEDTALYYCVTCPKLLCERCAHIHSVNPSRKEHQVVYLKDYPRQIPAEGPVDNNIPEHVYLARKRVSEKDNNYNLRQTKSESSDKWNREVEFRKGFRKPLAPTKQFSYSKSASSRTSSVHSFNESMGKASDKSSAKTEKSVATDASGLASMIKNSRFTIMVYNHSENGSSSSGINPGQVQTTRSREYLLDSCENAIPEEKEACDQESSKKSENKDSHNLVRKASTASLTSNTSYSSHCCHSHLDEFSSRSQSIKSPPSAISKSDTMDDISEILNVSNGPKTSKSSRDSPKQHKAKSTCPNSPLADNKQDPAHSSAANHDKTAEAATSNKIFSYQQQSPKQTSSPSDLVDELLSKNSDSSNPEIFAIENDGVDSQKQKSELNTTSKSFTYKQQTQLPASEKLDDDFLADSDESHSEVDEPCMKPQKPVASSTSSSSSLMERVRNSSIGSGKDRIEFIEEDLYESADDVLECNDLYLTHSSIYSEPDNLSNISEESALEKLFCGRSRDVVSAQDVAKYEVEEDVLIMYDDEEEVIFEVETLALVTENIHVIESYEKLPLENLLSDKEYSHYHDIDTNPMSATDNYIPSSLSPLKINSSTSQSRESIDQLSLSRTGSSVKKRKRSPITNSSILSSAVSKDSFITASSCNEFRPISHSSSITSKSAHSVASSVRSDSAVNLHELNTQPEPIVSETDILNGTVVDNEAEKEQLLSCTSENVNIVHVKVPFEDNNHTTRNPQRKHENIATNSVNSVSSFVSSSENASEGIITTNTDALSQESGSIISENNRKTHPQLTFSDSEDEYLNNPTSAKRITLDRVMNNSYISSGENLGFMENLSERDGSLTGVSSLPAEKMGSGGLRSQQSPSEGSGSDMSIIFKNGIVEPLPLTRVNPHRCKNVVIGEEPDELPVDPYTIYFPSMADFMLWSQNQSISAESSVEHVLNEISGSESIGYEDEDLYKHAELTLQHSLVVESGDTQELYLDKHGITFENELRLYEESVTSLTMDADTISVHSVDGRALSSTSTIVDDEEVQPGIQTSQYMENYSVSLERQEQPSDSIDVTNDATESLLNISSETNKSSSIYSAVGHLANAFNDAMEPEIEPETGILYATAFNDEIKREIKQKNDFSQYANTLSDPLSSRMQPKTEPKQFTASLKNFVNQDIETKQDTNQHLSKMFINDMSPGTKPIYDINQCVNEFNNAMLPEEMTPVKKKSNEKENESLSRKYSKRVSALKDVDNRKSLTLPRKRHSTKSSENSVKQTYTLPRRQTNKPGSFTNFLNNTYSNRGPSPKSIESKLLSRSLTFGSASDYKKFAGEEEWERSLPRHLGRKVYMRNPSLKQVDWSTMGRKGTEPGFLLNPTGIAVDEGCVAIAEEGNGRIQIFIEDESEYCINNLANPCGIALSPEHIYVSDIDTNVIHIYGRNALQIAELGGPGSQKGQFNEPRGLAVNPSNGDLAVCDTENHRVQIFDVMGNFIKSLGCKGKNRGEFREPISCCYDNWGRLLVSDHCNYRVQLFDTHYQYIADFGKYGKSSGEFWGVNGLCSHRNGDILVVDSDNNCLSVHSSDGRFISVFGRRGAERWEFLYPHSVSTDEVGNVYVSDWGNHRIHIMDKKLLPYLELESHML